MGKTIFYEIDGMKIEIPLEWDASLRRYLENYDELIDNPRCTPFGYPIIVIGQDACQNAPPGCNGLQLLSILRSGRRACVVWLLSKSIK